MELSACKYLISGEVQGVGFRYFARRKAAELQLAGWVRNLPDGCVEAYAIGTAASLDTFEKALRQGPPAGEVRDMQTESAPVDVRIEGFQIR
jgi:acylphosphatase